MARDHADRPKGAKRRLRAFWLYRHEDQHSDSEAEEEAKSPGHVS
jgi:hypothetical protein